MLKIVRVSLLMFATAAMLWCAYEYSPSGFRLEGFDIPPQTTAKIGAVESPCKNLNPGWRGKQEIDGVIIDRSNYCSPDDPQAVAAFVKGTNRVSMSTLMETELSPDAIVKGKDLDGDGDPDEIHIRLEVMELNGRTPESDQFVVPEYSIAPGIKPGFWVFTPKGRGMSTTNVDSLEANPLVRMPSPVIRVEQGDKIKITLENTHYLPHTIHLHGVDHPYVDANGEGNDGVPQTSETMVMPGDSRTYEFQPRQTGTMAYHCHVQPATHILMGLIGMLVVEENRPNNWVQTFNIGAGHVRHSSVAMKQQFDREFDLQYQGVDKLLHSLIQKANDPRLIAKSINQTYDITERKADYYLLNGRSFPYTLRESTVQVKPDTDVKLRVFNAGGEALALHTHGHKATITHYDGVEQNPAGQITRDVYSMAPAQRLDLKLSTNDDGLHAYGEGIWLIHDHFEAGITTDGMGPGGGVSAIIYDKYLNNMGMPKTQGVDVSPYFTKEFYQGDFPVWGLSDTDGVFGAVAKVLPSGWNIVIFGLSIGLAFGFIMLFVREVSSRDD